MKRLFGLIMFFALVAAPAMAETLKVQALQDFTTASPSKEFSVLVLDDVYIDGVLVIASGMTMHGLIFDIRDPKRLKRDAGFSFVPQYCVNGDGEKIYIKKKYYGKYAKGLDKGQLAKSAALSAANKVIFSGFSYGAAVVEGVVKNEDGNRVKSGARALYKSTPLSYVEKGADLEISEGDIFLLRFKGKDDKPDDDYEVAAKVEKTEDAE